MGFIATSFSPLSAFAELTSIVLYYFYYLLSFLFGSMECKQIKAMGSDHKWITM